MKQQKHLRANLTALFCAIFCLLGLCLNTASGQSSLGKHGKAPPTGNRYLFIVETSRAMERRSAGLQKTIGDLLQSDLNGQMQKYDTLGLWTFNQNLFAGQFPLQMWSSNGKKEITTGVQAFLKQQKFEKQSDLEKVIPSMQGVISNSDLITVVLLTSGDHKLQGTPFDVPINDSYQLWATEQQKARMPFVTVLRAKRGKIFDYVVSPAQWPLQIPPLPVEMRVAAVTNLPAPRRAQPNILPPLIVSGHHSNPQAVPADPVRVSSSENQAPAATVAATPAPATSISMQGSSGSTESSTPAPSAATSTPSTGSLPPRKSPSSDETTQSKAISTKADGSPAVTLSPPASIGTTPEPAQAAVVSPTPGVFNLKFLAAIGVALAAVAALAIMARAQRKTRPTTRTSLITRSLERGKE